MESEDGYKRDLRTFSYVNETIFSLLLFWFAIGRATRSIHPSYNIFKGKLRSLGALFSLTSILFSVFHVSIATYLSTIDGYGVGPDGYLKEGYKMKYKEYEIDLVHVLSGSLVTSRVLRMSAVFILVGLWGSCAHSAFQNRDRYTDISKMGVVEMKMFTKRSAFNPSIITFSKIYAFARILVFLYYYSGSYSLGERTSTFLESSLLGCEVYLAVMLLVILQAKHSFLSKSRSLDSTNLLVLCLFLYGFLTYIVNIVALPFEITDLHYQIQQSLKLGVRLALDALLISMFCPIGTQLFDNLPEKNIGNLEMARVPQLSNQSPTVQEIKSIVEFNSREDDE